MEKHTELITCKRRQLPVLIFLKITVFTVSQRHVHSSTSNVHRW